VNDALNAKHAIDSEGNARPSDVGNAVHVSVEPGTVSREFILDGGLCAGKYIMAQVSGVFLKKVGAHNPGDSVPNHYVVVTGVGSNEDTNRCDYRITDPGFNEAFLGGGSEISYTVKTIWRISTQ